MWWGCIWHHPIAPCVCAWTRRARSRPGSHPTRVAADVWQTQHAHASITSAMAQRRCSQRWPGHWQSHRTAKAPSPQRGIPAVPSKVIDAAVPGEQDIPPDHGQLRHAQDAGSAAWLAAHPRYHVHFTPTSASWLIWSSVFSQIQRAVDQAQAPTPALLSWSNPYGNTLIVTTRIQAVRGKSGHTILASVARAAGHYLMPFETPHWGLFTLFLPVRRP